jgi:hypothetical protein
MCTHQQLLRQQPQQTSEELRNSVFRMTQTLVSDRTNMASLLSTGTCVLLGFPDDMSTDIQQSRKNLLGALPFFACNAV